MLELCISSNSSEFLILNKYFLNLKSYWLTRSSFLLPADFAQTLLTLRARRVVMMGPISPLSTSGTWIGRSIVENPHALNSYKGPPSPQVPISLMDSDSQAGCLGNFFWSTLHRIKPPRPKSSSQSCNSQITTIAKGRSEVAQQKEGIQYLSPLCDYSYSPPDAWWSSARPPSYFAKESFSAIDDEVSATVEQTLDELNPKLRDLSLKIHGIFFIVS